MSQIFALKTCVHGKRIPISFYSAPQDDRAIESNRFHGIIFW